MHPQQLLQSLVFYHINIMEHLSEEDFKPKLLNNLPFYAELPNTHTIKSLVNQAKTFFYNRPLSSATRNLTIDDEPPEYMGPRLGRSPSQKEGMLDLEISRPVMQLYALQSLAVLHTKIANIANSNITNDIDFLVGTFAHKFGFEEGEPYNDIAEMEREINDEWDIAFAYKDRIMPLFEEHAEIMDLFKLLDEQHDVINVVYWGYVREFKARLNKFDQHLQLKRSDASLILSQINKRIAEKINDLAPKLMTQAINDDKCLILTLKERLAKAHERRVNTKLYKSFVAHDYVDSPLEYSHFIIDVLSENLTIYSSYDINFKGEIPENDIWNFISALVEVAILERLVNDTPIPTPFFPIPGVEVEAPATKASVLHSIISSSYSEEQVKVEAEMAAHFTNDVDNSYAILLKVMQDKNRICVNLKDDGFKAFATLLMDWQLPTKADNVTKLSNSIRPKYRNLFDGNDTWRRNSKVLGVYENMLKCFP